MMGLAAGDVIDALSHFDSGLPEVVDTSLDVAVFSLAPGSPSLNANPPCPAACSTSDLFYTDFGGTFEIASDLNLNLNGWKVLAKQPAIKLTADTLGLLPSDDVDALEFACTSVGGVLALPPPVVPALSAGTMLLLAALVALAGIVCVRRFKPV